MPSQDTSTGYAQLFQENHFKCKSRSDKMIHFWLQSASDREAGQFAVRPNFLSEKKWCTLNLKPHKICVVSELQITSHRLQFLKVMFRYFLLNKWQYLFHFHSPFNNRTEAKKRKKRIWLKLPHCFSMEEEIVKSLQRPLRLRWTGTTNISLFWKRRWKFSHIFSCSALLAWGASVYNVHLWGPVAFTLVAESLAVEMSLPVLRLRSVAAGIRTPKLLHQRGANALNDCRIAHERIVCGLFCNIKHVIQICNMYLSETKRDRC